jgi:hypothetical protein
MADGALFLHWAPNPKGGRMLSTVLCAEHSAETLGRHPGQRVQQLTATTPGRCARCPEPEPPILDGADPCL